eukprot:TRINITY_DN6000_c0_g2_i1.p1 TRINITY_DN6000_c0_g2~~TRINITY_DN6000_c0_g2_i1.p1  ORF type:complete len:491 (-),score=107.29 TRINITY_DN6000_c0_g2_i1:64-1536(-)
MSSLPEVMLAESWTEDIDPTGYWMSEKLDGVRAYWDGHNFYSRQKIRYHAPKFFRADLPNTPLDGELWCGRGQFQKCVSIVKKKDANVSEEEWKYVTFLVFDAPSHKGLYEDRVKYLHTVIDSTKDTTYASVVGIKKCKGKEHLDETLKSVLKVGGEGVMLRLPRSKYEHKRSNNLLKVKKFFDEEAKVIGYRAGTGRLTGMMGAIECELPNEKVFHIGTGFADSQRTHTGKPKIGQVVTFKYQELSNNGHPRFPVFLRVREDVTWEDVLENYKKNPPFSATQKVVPQLKKDHTLLFSAVTSRDDEGKKVKSDANNDSDEDILKADKKTKVLPMCKYGEKCYRNNKEHLESYSHPPRVNPKTTKTNEETKYEEKPKPTAQPEGNESDSDSDNTLPLISNINASISDESTLPLDDIPKFKCVKMDEESDSESDDNEQALISAAEWRKVLKRISQLESQVFQLQTAFDNPTNKRAREADEEEEYGKKKPRYQ